MGSGLGLGIQIYRWRARIGRRSKRPRIGAGWWRDSKTGKCHFWNYTGAMKNQYEICRGTRYCKIQLNAISENPVLLKIYIFCEKGPTNFERQENYEYWKWANKCCIYNDSIEIGENLLVFADRMAARQFPSFLFTQPILLPLLAPENNCGPFVVCGETQKDRVATCFNEPKYWFLNE